MNNRSNTAQPIRFTLGKSSLGPVLVATTATGVCAIFFGEHKDALKSDLEAGFPGSPLKQDDGLAPLLDQVLKTIESPALACDLTLDMQGTLFQQRVWRALMSIPCGSTVSYSELAQSMGAPRAARAVARACAANRIAVVIPCHRVVRSDGALSGYRWGPERKRSLLDSEATK